jgi:hypothetical protein
MRSGRLTATNLHRRLLSATLALILLFSSMPLTAGLVLAGNSSERILSLNLCHRSDGATVVAPIALARPKTVALQPMFAKLEETRLEASAVVSELPIEPENPPPEISH